MAATTMQFPETPSVGDEVVFNGTTYSFDGVKWITRSGALSSKDWVQSEIKLAVGAALKQAAKAGRNLLINGDFRVDQRNNKASVSCAVGTKTYPADRWIVTPVGSAVTAQAGTVDNYNYLKLTGAAGVTAVTLTQRIEAANCLQVAGKKCSVSATINVTGGTGVVVEAHLLHLNTTADDWSTAGNIVDFATVDLKVGAAGRYTCTFDVPAVAIRGQAIQFKITGLVAGVSVTFSEVQYEVGEWVTPFEYRAYGYELSLCQRYYQEILYPIGGQTTGANTSIGNTLVYPTALRWRPTVTTKTGATSVNVLNFVYSSQTVSSVLTVATVGTAAQWNWLGTVILDAEL